MLQELKDELLLHYTQTATPEHFLAVGADEIDDILARGFVPLSFVISNDPQWTSYAVRMEAQYPCAPLFVADEQEVLDYIDQVLAAKDEREGRMARVFSPEPVGARAAFRAPKLASLSEVLVHARRLVVCENVRSKRNAGTIMQLARELCYDAVLFAGTSPYPYARMYRLHSSGASLEIPVVTLTDWPFDLDLLKAQGFTIVGTALREDALAIDDERLKQQDKVALLLGSEHDGLTEEAIERCDYLAIIPMREGIDSLNVACAAAVALYELGESDGTCA